MRQNQSSGWKGSIVSENGVKVVKNPAQPLYGEFVFQPQEDLKIGDPGQDAYYFPKGAFLAVDSEGHIYNADHGNERVQMYDRSGRYLRTIGRRGQGPGEYMFPGQVLIDDEGNPCAGPSSKKISHAPSTSFRTPGSISIG